MLLGRMHLRAPRGDAPHFVGQIGRCVSGSLELGLLGGNPRGE